MTAGKTRYFRKSAERAKGPRKRHGKLVRFMEINKDTTTNPHAKNKKANAANPHGKSHQAGAAARPKAKKRRLGSRK